MATPRVRVDLPANGSWTSIEGTAASVAGMTWQNTGGGAAQIAFTTAQPIATDAFNTLPPLSAVYDANGSAKVWARCIDGMGATITGVSD